MTVYYNEIDPFAAEWLRRLMIDGYIAWGDVDERSIEDVSPDDLRGYRQCHFFAGIGVWSYALRRAGWDDDRPIWTGSCPCQPFSAAGKGGGFADERHLWPAFFHLIRECDPSVVVGEQVASKYGLTWLDLVRADVEGEGRAFAAADLCAASFGAPHIRQRAYWLAYSVNDGQRQHRDGVGIAPRAGEGRSGERQRLRVNPADGGAVDRLAYAANSRRERGWSGVEGDGRAETRVESERLRDADRLDHHHARPQGHAGDDGAAVGREEPGRSVTSAGVSGGLADDEAGGRREERAQPRRDDGGNCAEGIAAGLVPSRPTDGFWRDADWLYCRDGKWRPVEPGTFPLAHGAPARVGRLRGYGNAIVAPVAQGFIEAVMGIL